MGVSKTGWALLLLAGVVAGQTLDNSKLTGKYYFRQVSYSTDTASILTDIRSLLGSITFSGAGAFTVTAQQNIGNGGAAAFTGTGTYSMSPAGLVTLSNPLNSAVTINARWGTEALIGSTTEVATNTFDIFVAIPAPTAAQNLASLSGNYSVATLEFPVASARAVRNTSFSLQSTGAGSFLNFNVQGHEADIGGGAPTTEFVSGSYTMNTDGTGLLIFNLNTGAPLLNGTKNLYISRSGNVILGGSPLQGSQDLLIGIKTISGATTNASWSGNFWTAGMRYDPTFPFSHYAGSLAATPSLGKLSSTRREHGINIPGGFEFTGANDYTMNSDGTGTSLSTRVALGAGGDLFIASNIDANDPTGYVLDFGVRMPTLSGTGVFLNPNGIANGGSFAFAGAAISPGEFIALGGTGLSDTTVTSPPPYPPTLGGVSVTVNGLAAPLYYVSPIQLNVLVPYTATGAKATIVVTNNGKISNSVDVLLAKTSPGIFTQNASGTGPAWIRHLDSTPVTPANPAHRGEIVVMVLTGLGTVTPGVPDGTPAPASGDPLSKTDLQPPALEVRIGDVRAPIGFAGLAPGFPGLYQINLTIPPGVLSGDALPIAIFTTDAFHDQADIAVQ